MRTYVKPELVYENFQLNHTIANCAPGGTPSSPIDIGNDMTLFNTTMNCSITDPSVYEGYCLETSTGATGTFGS